MHEMSIAQSIIDIAIDEAAKHAADKVKRIVIEVGALACVDPHALEFGFEAVSNGSVAEGARLEILSVPATAYCFSCEDPVEVRHAGSACPVCGSRQLMMKEGDDLRVKEMEVV